MKKILFVAMAIVLGISALTMLSSDNAEATIYPYGYTGQWTPVNYSSAPAGWNYIRQTASFTAATDTLFFLWSPTAPDANSNDTLIAYVNTITKPASGTGDTVNVELEYWTSSDTSGWRIGNVTTNSGVWKKTTIGRDSTATGFNRRQTPIGITTYGGRQPFNAIVAIGKAALTNGKGNEAGVRVQVDIIEQ